MDAMDAELVDEKIQAMEWKQRKRFPFLYVLYCDVLSSLIGPTWLFMSRFERRAGCIKVQFNSLLLRKRPIWPIGTVRNGHIRQKPL